MSSVDNSGEEDMPLFPRLLVQKGRTRLIQKGYFIRQMEVQAHSHIQICNKCTESPQLASHYVRCGTRAVTETDKAPALRELTLSWGQQTMAN